MKIRFGRREKFHADPQGLRLRRREWFRRLWGWRSYGRRWQCDRSGGCRYFSFQLCGGSESSVPQRPVGWVFRRTDSLRNGVIFLERLLFAAQPVKRLRYGKYGFGVLIKLTELVEIPEGFGEVASLEIHFPQQIERLHMIRVEGESFFGIAGGCGEITAPALRYCQGCPMLRFPAVQLQALLGETELNLSFPFFFPSGVGHSDFRIDRVKLKLREALRHQHSIRGTRDAVTCSFCSRRGAAAVPSFR